MSPKKSVDERASIKSKTNYKNCKESSHQYILTILAYSVLLTLAKCIDLNGNIMQYMYFLILGSYFDATLKRNKLLTCSDAFYFEGVTHQKHGGQYRTSENVFIKILPEYVVWILDETSVINHFSWEDVCIMSQSWSKNRVDVFKKSYTATKVARKTTNRWIFS